MPDSDNDDSEHRFAISRAVEAFVDDLRDSDGLGLEREPLAALALELARTLDMGAGMATAAVAKELRATLVDLTPQDGGDDDDELVARLSAPMEHTAN